ncbi:uncharacterized protein PAC_17266 [Phialocephala subalpina]|uniref:Major facilitator superfamily (MFS) profile domain-containing protein n=1 Tax=Phialocephala subalpina TaxID=576137 RepID=A0A1L7XR09_9HELO|nr:uncharacterized protein PAC_17266 [Phialocephala subalpina]
MSEKTADYGRKGSVFLITSNGETIQLPIPSRSPNDPLKWSNLKKFLALLSMYVFTTIGLVQVQGTSLLLHALQDEYSPEVTYFTHSQRNNLTKKEIAPFRLDVLSSVPCLFWGIGALIWVPLSIAIGRRPVFLLCSLLLTLSTLMAAVSRSFYMHLIARCLQGIAGGISPSTMLLMVIDLTFIHQRPRYIALFWSVCNGLSNVGLAFTPYIASGSSWRAFYWVWLGPCALTIVLALAWSPETYFQRVPMAFDGHILAQSESGSVTVYSKWDEVPGGKPIPDVPQTRSASLKSIPSSNPHLHIQPIDPLGIGPERIRVWWHGHHLRNLWDWRYILFFVGLDYFSAISLFTSNALWVTEAFPRWAGPAIVIVGAGGYGLSFALGSSIEPWIASQGLGNTYLELAALTCAISLFTSNALWVTEAFPRWAGPAIVIVGAGGYGLSFALGSSIEPWIASQGLGNTYLELAALTWLVGLVGLPVNFWGKKFREYIYSNWDHE